MSAASAGFRTRLACTAPRAAVPLPAALRGGGLDLSASMFAPCLLGRPGTGRQNPVLMSLRLAGLRYSSACHSIPVTQVFKKVSLSSGLLIRGFGVQVSGGAPGLTWGFTTPGHFFRVRFVPLVAPWLLARTDPAIRVLSKTALPRPVRGHSTRSCAASHGRRHPGSIRPMV